MNLELKSTSYVRSFAVGVCLLSALGNSVESRAQDSAQMTSVESVNSGQPLPANMHEQLSDGIRRTHLIASRYGWTASQEVTIRVKFDTIYEIDQMDVTSFYVPFNWVDPFTQVYRTFQASVVSVRPLIAGVQWSNTLHSYLPVNAPGSGYGQTLDLPSMRADELEITFYASEEKWYEVNAGGPVSDDELYFNATEFKFTGTPIECRGWTNPINNVDVNEDGYVSAIDYLIIVNAINRGLSDLPECNFYGYMIDVDGNGYVSARDALIVLNAM